MSIKNLLWRYTFPLLKPSINPRESLKTLQNLKSLLIYFSTHTPNSTKSQNPSSNGKLGSKNKRPLDILYKQALGLCEKDPILGSLSDENDENSELKKKLHELELEIRVLKASSSLGNGGNLKVFESKTKGIGKREKDGSVSSSKPKSLAALFDRKVEEGEGSIGEVNEVVMTEISQDMQVLLRHLYDRGYFKDANFLTGNRFDMNCFYEEYARDYVKFALERFGKDHQEISKWLSGSDMKTIALFGCPSTSKRDVFASKNLRLFFEIEEDSVCGQCVLKNSCKYANQSVLKGDHTILRLDLLLRLLRAYSQEETPSGLELTDDLKACVSRLIHEVMNLTKGVDKTISGGSADL